MARICEPTRYFRLRLKLEILSYSFWYLDREDSPRDIVLDPLEPKLEWIKDKAKELKKAIDKGEWVCIKGDPSTSSGQCRDCTDYQAIIDGKGQFQFTDHRYKKDVYYLGKQDVLTR